MVRLAWVPRDGHVQGCSGRGGLTHGEAEDVEDGAGDHAGQHARRDQVVHWVSEQHAQGVHLLGHLAQGAGRGGGQQGPSTGTLNTSSWPDPYAASPGHRIPC